MIVPCLLLLLLLWVVQQLLWLPDHHWQVQLGCQQHNPLPVTVELGPSWLLKCSGLFPAAAAADIVADHAYGGLDPEPHIGQAASALLLLCLQQR
jgi:hypothetical protein